MDEKKIKWIRYGITALCDLLLAGFIAYGRYTGKPYGGEVIINEFHALSDGFFIVGFLNLAFGLLLWISTTGIFDILSYGLKAALYLFTSKRKDKDEGGYYEYKMRKNQKRKAVPFETLWIGAGMIVVGIILFLFV